MTVAHPHEEPLTGTALLLWQAVVIRGEHLTFTRGGGPAAVMLPLSDYEAALALLGAA